MVSVILAEQVYSQRLCGLAMTNKNNFLISEKIQETIEKLYFRINDRFPNSGLSNVCKMLHAISLETKGYLKIEVKVFF